MQLGRRELMLGLAQGLELELAQPVERGDRPCHARGLLSRIVLDGRLAQMSGADREYCRLVTGRIICSRSRDQLPPLRTRVERMAFRRSTWVRTAHIHTRLQIPDR